mmetsp:Transcript_14205/g.35777  ORF Transcript_14205/g.35777 Transcript_14205/m.35777 type:complete len:518 (-) Transcript_14205:57-1610(-)
MSFHSMKVAEGLSTESSIVVETIQRSGMFGKLLTVERETCTSVANSLRSNGVSYRSNVSNMSSTRYKGKDGKEDSGLDIGIAPPQHAKWQSIGAIMVSEVVGAGVLTLSRKYAQLGWIPATIFIVVIFLITVYTSNMMVEVKKVFPAIISMADAADYTFGRVASSFVQVLMAIFLCTTLGDYMLLIGKSLASTLYSVHLCFPVWVTISLLVIFPVMQLRTLNSTTALCVMNMVSICAAVALVIAGLVIDGRDPGVETFLVAEDLDFLTFMQALSAIFFTFGGQFMFYELMAEMTDFTEFPWTFSIAGPFQVPIYLIVGTVGYHYKGVDASGYFLDNLPFGWMYRLASALLCFHMLIAFLILGNVLSRILHLYFSPYRVNDLGLRGKLEWLGCTSLVIVVSFVVANAIPFFEELTSLIGGLLVPSLNMIFPILFYIRTKQMVDLKIKGWEWVVYVFLIAFGALVTVVSTYMNLKAIIDGWSTYGAPFSCHCDQIWNTCDCSPTRMEFTGFNCSIAEAP